MKRTLLTFSLFALTTLSSCITISIGEPAVGPVEERTITIGEKEITAIAVSSGADVIVDSTVARGEVRVLTHTDIFDNLKIEVEDSTLDIGLKSGQLRTTTFEVRVPAYNYNVAALSGGSDLEWEGCNANDLTVAVSGGADIEICGRCTNLVVAASGGADADFEELIAESVSVAASGGADVIVYATKSLEINASGGADVYYGGNPANKSINKAGGADVSAID